MAITETGVVISTLQGIQGTYTEEGQVYEIEVNGLTPNTSYRATAYCIDNGIQATSETTSFTTIEAGTITLEHISTTRSGYGYDVTYRYTSTYAPSSAILSTNGTQFQGFIDSAQNAISFWVTGLTAGTAYLTNVTLYDIYAESATVTGSIVATVVNEVRITDTTPSETSVVCELEYVLDGGFYIGYVEYWLEDEDPSTDQPQGHFYFNDGDETCTVDGLTSGETYQFKATITLNDQTTTVSSSVASATTTVDLKKQYLTITNTSNTSGNVGVYRVSGNTGSPYNLYYTLDGNTWTNHYNWEAYQTINVPAGGSVSFKGNFSDGLCNENNTFRFGGNLASCTLSGNPFSLRNTNPNTFSTYTSTLPYEFRSLFSGLSNLTDASGLSTSQITDVGERAFEDTFRVYGSALTTPPDFSGVETVAAYGFAYTFYYLTNLSVTPNFSNVLTVGDYGFKGTLSGTSIRETPDFGKVRSIGKGGFESTFARNTSLIRAHDFSSLTESGESGFSNTFGNCTSLEKSPSFKKFTEIGDYIFSATYSGCTALTEVIAPNVSTWDENMFSNWLYNVSARGVVNKPAGLEIPTDTVNGVPSGWTTQDY